MGVANGLQMHLECQIGFMSVVYECECNEQVGCPAWVCSRARHGCMGGSDSCFCFTGEPEGEPWKMRDSPLNGGRVCGPIGSDGARVRVCSRGDMPPAEQLTSGVPARPFPNMMSSIVARQGNRQTGFTERPANGPGSSDMEL